MSTKTDKPLRGLMDPRFVYVPASKTDIRATFERARANPLIPVKSTPKAPS